jgi:predicted nucleotidyltransferase
MSSTATGPTPFPYVNSVLELLLAGLRDTLGNYFVGLYLQGSLASGDFDPGHSDIDFLVVTTEELPEKMLPALETMHHRIWDSGLEWAKKLEGSYMPKNSLYLYNPEDPPRPGIFEGNFLVFRHEIHWVINRHILRESGVVVYGPPLRPMIAPVTTEEIRRAVITGLLDAWTEKLDEREWLKPPGHQPYIALTCCRALYTLEHGEIMSKAVSARWAMRTLDTKWRNLIKNALAWHYGLPPGDIEMTLQMMKYTLERVKQYPS